jgi:hypothetical protein
MVGSRRVYSGYQRVIDAELATVAGRHLGEEPLALLRCRPMKKRKNTKRTPNPDPAARALERQRKRAARLLLKRRQKKSGQ